jgi:hypothetical protein
MLVDGCFRLSQHGSVIHDKYDTDKYKFIHYKEIVIGENMHDNIYYPKNYLDVHTDFYAMCEAALLADPRYRLSIEWNNLQFNCYTDTGVCDCRRVPEEEPYNTFNCIAINCDGYAECGVEVTEYCQLRFTSKYPYRIVYKDGYIYSSKGKFKLPREIEAKLTGYIPNIAPYKIIRESDEYFGWLYLKDGLAFLSLFGDKISFKEVPYGNQT